jgi:hypothetical protein
MSTNNALGYCPSCKQNVLLVREAVNWALIILLIIFTGGIGLIVYAIVYFNKPPSRCIHCRSQIEPQSSNLSEKNVGGSIEDNETSKQRFCSYCGEALRNADAKFCAHCGSKV